MPSNYFIDAEFTATRGKDGAITIVPISLAIVKESGESLYLVADRKFPEANDWVQENVLNPIGLNKKGLIDRDPNLQNSQARATDRALCLVSSWSMLIRDFISDSSPTFWADSPAFDYVLLSSVMGEFWEWPSGWPYGFEDINRIKPEGFAMIDREGQNHNALDDAKHVRAEWLALNP